jgi:hypothetical protein
MSRRAEFEHWGWRYVAILRPTGDIELYRVTSGGLEMFAGLAHEIASREPEAVQS